MAISQDCSEFQENLGEFETFYRRFPRRFAPRNDKAEALCHTEDTPMFSPCLPSETSGWTGFSTPRRKNEMYRPASRTVSLSKSPFGSFAKLPSKLQNVFCSSVLQFCRCGGLLNAKGHPDGFLSLFSSLRNLRLDWFFDTQTQKRNVPPGKPGGTFRRKERKREKKEKMHEKERGCDLWKTSDQGRGLSCSDGSSALADVVGSSFCTASSLLSNTMGRRNVLP